MKAITNNSIIEIKDINCYIARYLNHLPYLTYENLLSKAIADWHNTAEIEFGEKQNDSFTWSFANQEENTFII